MNSNQEPEVADVVFNNMLRLAYAGVALQAIATGKDEMEMYCITYGVKVNKGEPLSRAIAKSVLNEMGLPKKNPFGKD